MTIVDYNHGENVATQVLLLKQKGVQAVLNATFEPDLLRMLKNMKTLKYSPLIGSNEDALGTEAAKQYPQLAKGVSLFGFAHISDTFTEKVKQRDPNNTLVSLEAAALAYLHIKQLYQTILACGADSQCQQRTFAQSAPNGVIAFQGWSNRVAQFDVSLKEWSGDRFEVQS